MLRKSWWLVIVLVLALTLVAVLFVSAGTFRNPARDTACWPDTPTPGCYNNFGVQVEAQLPQGGGACAPYAVGYIGWDLSTQPTQTWKSAALTLTAYAVAASGTPPFTFALYAVNSETWTEDDFTGGGPGYGGPPLITATTSLTPQIGDRLVFSDTVANTLGTYFLGKKGGPASVAVVMTGGCGPASLFAFEDIEGTTPGLKKLNANGPTNPKAADLVFFTGDATNAVTLSTFRAADPTVNWPLIAAALLLVAALAGFGVYRWRVSQVRAR